MWSEKRRLRTEAALAMRLDVHEWAREQFGTCDLGDRRRTERAVKIGAQMAAQPDGSTPKQTETWADCKAAYRLFNRASFADFTQPHRSLTRESAKGICLLLGDTTETDFGIHRKVTGLGPTGDGKGRGFLLHSSLMVLAESRETVGIAGQELFYRKPVPPKRESHLRRKQRPRESEVWGRVIDQVGPPPQDAKFIHVLDAGADNYEVFCHLVIQGAGWVIRAAQLTRIVVDNTGSRRQLRDVLQTLPVIGTYELFVRARDKNPARTAKVEVRSGQITMPAPQFKSPFLRQNGIHEIPMWVVEVREVEAPKGVDKPLHWVLYTSEPVPTFASTWTIIEYYELRWLIEEYHKCLKTGCRIEERQFRSAKRLEAVAGMICVLAVRLLQLKSLARTDPDRPAERVVPKRWVEMLRRLRKGGRPVHTVREFFRALAQLGGFLARKGDGEPGWMTIWRGLDKLILCLRGAAAIRLQDS